MKSVVDFLVIGGGVAGMNTAKRLATQGSVLLIEKDQCGAHASSKNSGVIHAGIYYGANSLKSQFCVKGNVALTEFHKKYDIPYLPIGKILCMTSPNQKDLLHELYHNAKENCLADVHLIDYHQAKEIEPRIQKHDVYIWSPLTAVGDPKSVIKYLKLECQEAGVEIQEGVSYIEQLADEPDVMVKTTQGNITCRYLVNAAGLYTDKIAHEFGFGRKYEVLPFKGVYSYANEGFRGYNTLVYPVPEFKKHAFVGVHTTETVSGKTKIGPTAMPAFWRQQYHGMDNFNFRELCEISYRLARCGLSDYKSLYFELLWKEMNKYRIKNLLKDVQPMVEDAFPMHFEEWGRSCIYPQLVDKTTQQLVIDFLVEGDHKSIHVLNNVSPGWTCAIPFSEHIYDTVMEKIQKN